MSVVCGGYACRASVRLSFVAPRSQGRAEERWETILPLMMSTRGGAHVLPVPLGALPAGSSCRGCSTGTRHAQAPPPIAT